MARGITLHRREQSRVYVPNRGEGFRLYIVAADGVGMPDEIFLHRQRTVNPRTGDQGEMFSCVCSPFDLTAYPALEPDLSQSPPFYRKSVIDIVLPSQTVAEATWQDIYDEVNGLIEALNKLDLLGPAVTVRCGDDLSSESDSSVS